MPAGGRATAKIEGTASPRPSARDRFNSLSRNVTEAVGAPAALGVALAAVAVWALSGPIFGFSDTWQLAMNTVSSIITFCMVFVIQASQNRDSRAIQLKLDEIIRSSSEARNDLINLESAPEERVNETAEELSRIASTSASGSRPEETGSKDPSGVP